MSEYNLEKSAEEIIDSFEQKKQKVINQRKELNAAIKESYELEIALDAEIKNLRDFIGIAALSSGYKLKTKLSLVK